MNTIEEARKHLRQFTKEYNEAVFSREECRKNMAACALQHRESVDPIKNSLDESLKFAMQAEALAEQHVKNALKQVRSQQVAFDKLKHKAAETKKQEKQREQRKNKERNPKPKPNREEDSSGKSGSRGPQERYFRNEARESRKRFPRPERIWREKETANTEPSAWKLRCDNLLQDRTTMAIFPNPPHSTCTKRPCTINRSQRALKACECNIAEALMQDPQYPSSLKTERWRWHPEKLYVCPEEYRFVFLAKAREIFVVVNRLFEIEMGA